MTSFSYDAVNEWLTRARSARPFLRWAGGKQPFLLRFGNQIPAFSGKMIEPFLGSGSVFFYVQKTQGRPCPAVLGDINIQLVKTFIAVRDEPERVYAELAELQNSYERAADKAVYYQALRKLYNAELPRVTASNFIFLNRTCWNGLYRVNQAGKFNVPYGMPRNEFVIPTRDDLLNVSAALAQAQIRATTWENSIAFAERGDFVFLDPPYYSDVVSESTKYKSRPFDLQQHKRLAEMLVQLDRRGIYYILTNSGEDEMIELYSTYKLNAFEVMIPRSINSKLDQRVAAKELVVSNCLSPLFQGPQ